MTYSELDYRLELSQKLDKGEIALAEVITKLKTLEMTKETLTPVKIISSENKK